MIKLIDILSELKITPKVSNYLFLYNGLTYGVMRKRLGVVINNKYSNRDLDAKTEIGPGGITIYTPGKRYDVYPWTVYFESPNEVAIELEIRPQGYKDEFNDAEYDDYVSNVKDTKKILAQFNPKIEEEEGYDGDFTKFILDAGIFPNHEKIYDEWKNQR
jgi:hypothetical protein